MSRIVTVPGTNRMILPGAPVISNTAWEREVANLPGLVHVIDPSKLDARGRGRDRMSQSLLSEHAASANAKNAANVIFNNLPTITVNATGGIEIGAGSVGASYTFVCASLLSTGVRGTSTVKNLLVSAVGNSFGASLRSQSGSLLYDAMTGGGTTQQIPAANTSLGGIAEIWSVSFDGGTKKSMIGCNGILSAEGAHTTVYNPTTSSRWIYGGSAATTGGWVGDLGIALLFDRALHTSAMKPYYLRAIALLEEYYSI